MGELWAGISKLLYCSECGGVYGREEVFMMKALDWRREPEAVDKYISVILACRHMYPECPLRRYQRWPGHTWNTSAAGNGNVAVPTATSLRTKRLKYSVISLLQDYSISKDMEFYSKTLPLVCFFPIITDVNLKTLF